jgi:hypothetical protein
VLRDLASIVILESWVAGCVPGVPVTSAKGESGLSQSVISYGTGRARPHFPPLQLSSPEPLTMCLRNRVLSQLSARVEAHENAHSTYTMRDSCDGTTGILRQRYYKPVMYLGRALPPLFSLSTAITSRADNLTDRTTMYP